MRTVNNLCLGGIISNCLSTLVSLTGDSLFLNFTSVRNFKQFYVRSTGLHFKFGFYAFRNQQRFQEHLDIHYKS